tara:strand:+ start:10376 stop:11377 length:1002 start_codon:yes stop_codon:yes gene_type:complete
MTKLKNKYVIGCHVMFYEIEIYKEYIDGLINLLETIDNKENVYIDMCFNISDKIEKVDTDKITEEDLLLEFQRGVQKLKDLGMSRMEIKIVHPNDGFYFHADYRRDLNYNYCKKVDYIMHGETDSFFPKEALQALESLSQYTNENNIHRYAVCFADRKMWDSSWDPTVHPKYINHVFEDGPKANLNPNQAKSRMSIEEMNKINSEVEDFDFTYINFPKIDGSCLVLSADLIKFGVNVPSCLIYNDDNGLAIMAEKLLGQNYIQFICKNLLKVHARRHPLKRLYVLDEVSDTHTGNLNKSSAYDEFRRLSDANIQTLASSLPNKFYEYKDFKND